MFVTSLQLDRVLLFSIAMTTGAFAQWTVLCLWMDVLEVARCCGVDLVMLLIVGGGVKGCSVLKVLKIIIMRTARQESEVPK